MSSEIETLLRGPQGYALAKKAIEAMETHKVWPTAINFELWVNYVGARQSPLAQELDQLIATGEPLTDEVGEQLAAEYLPGARLTGQILTAGHTLTKELDSVSRAIEVAREAGEAYGQQLATATESFDQQDSASVRQMVASLTDATKKIRDENLVLESQLADTTQELDRLRDHLEQVRRDAMTDALTNLANRKAFDEALERACEQADLTGDIVTLAVVDIDHFKSFNDTWGHQTGDQVLRYVAAVIGRSATNPRTAARYGGEEFALIFPGDQAEVAFGLLEEAREEVSSRVLKRRSTNEDLGAITISAGIAERLPGEIPSALIERADEALYASKRSGRNRTTVAQPLSASKAA